MILLNQDRELINLFESKFKIDDSYDPEIFILNLLKGTLMQIWKSPYMSVFI